MLTVKRMLSYISSPESCMHLFVIMMNICCMKEILDISTKIQSPVANTHCGRNYALRVFATVANTH